MHKTISEYVSSCDVCQKSKADIFTSARLFQPLPIPDQVWEDIFMDFIEGLPTSHDKSVIFFIFDRLTRSAHFATLSRPYTAKIVAELLINTIVKLNGMSRSIVSIMILYFSVTFDKNSLNCLAPNSR